MPVKQNFNTAPLTVEKWECGPKKLNYLYSEEELSSPRERANSQHLKRNVNVETGSTTNGQRSHAVIQKYADVVINGVFQGHGDRDFYIKNKNDKEQDGMPLKQVFNTAPLTVEKLGSGPKKSNYLFSEEEYSSPRKRARSQQDNDNLNVETKSTTNGQRSHAVIPKYADVVRNGVFRGHGDRDFYLKNKNDKEHGGMPVKKVFNTAPPTVEKLGSVPKKFNYLYSEEELSSPRERADSQHLKRNVNVETGSTTNGQRSHAVIPKYADVVRNGVFRGHGDRDFYLKKKNDKEHGGMPVKKVFNTAPPTVEKLGSGPKNANYLFSEEELSSPRERADSQHLKRNVNVETGSTTNGQRSHAVIPKYADVVRNGVLRGHGDRDFYLKKKNDKEHGGMPVKKSF
ncbi:repeat gene hypothetical protein [Leishmania braziliensis MHOM/BR/75/M2904]|uniref:Uncharacterized protein n=1 Tax=Leishmania braziliensis TaxID=5660 RepID=A4H3H0_LEIBR|nr:repeat gene hypothetical protein [Leishmania braziliensis MHOM/BR/75/M2904]CAM41476.1 repeat gene hypothetical protein [Leishmania braziliensis MHOM/BR/75/M2904]